MKVWVGGPMTGRRGRIEVMDNLWIGTGRSDITPAPGCPQGIWSAQTHERGVVADLPLYATALAISDSRQTALIIDVDAIGFNAEWSGKILDAVAAMTSVPREHIRVASTHTHSGPKTQRLEIIDDGLEMDFSPAGGGVLGMSSR